MWYRNARCVAFTGHEFTGVVHSSEVVVLIRIR